jgi:hypothetical protein
VRNWEAGVTSTFQLTCTQGNEDIGLQAGDYYRTTERFGEGNFTSWTCLEYHEVIVGGSAGSPHEDFSDDNSGGGDVPKKKGLSGGAIAGIVIAVLVVVVVALLLWLCCCPPLAVKIFMMRKFKLGR